MNFGVFLTKSGNNAGIDTVYIGTGTYKLDAELIVEDVVIGGCSSNDGIGISRKYPGAVSNNSNHQTILDGNSLVLSLPSQKHRVATVKTDGIIEGCVIRNGHARGTTDNPTDMSGFGGGVLVDGGKVHNCIIRGNVAMNMAYSTINPSKGGGVFITNNGGEVVNCIIVFNLDDTGLCVDGNAGSVVNNTIARNSNAPKYALIEGTIGENPYQHYNGGSGAIGPYIHLDDFYMAKTETTQGQYACFLAAIDLASDYSAADWMAMCSAFTPMVGYTTIAISKYLGITAVNVSTAPALISADASNPQWLGISGTAGSGSEVYYPLKAVSKSYAAGTSSGVSYPEDPLVRENFPMANVSWYGSVAFCVWIGGMLPTEAQWEYAARKKADGSVQNEAAYAGGHTDAKKVGWYDANGNMPHEVATLLPTGLDLYDMNGNLWEWCADVLLDPYPSNASVDLNGDAANGAYLSTSPGVAGNTPNLAVHNPIYNYDGSTGVSLAIRVRRGGGYRYNVSYFSLGYRLPYAPPSAVDTESGFRSAACVGL